MKIVHQEQITPQIKFCRFGGRFGQAMSEYVLAYIVAEERNFKMTYEAEAKASWLVLIV